MVQNMAYVIIIFKELRILREIGFKLKEAREAIGVSVEEVAEDLKLKVSQIENLESGNMEAFQDVFYLKYFIKDYAKYLGLKHEDLVDEFNEYLFDYTSKISIDDVKKKQGSIDDNKDVIHSPYTKKLKEPFKFISVVPYIVIVLIAIVIAFIIL